MHPSPLPSPARPAVWHGQQLLASGPRLPAEPRRGRPSTTRLLQSQASSASQPLVCSGPRLLQAEPSRGRSSTTRLLQPQASSANQPETAPSASTTTSSSSPSPCTTPPEGASPAEAFWSQSTPARLRYAHYIEAVAFAPVAGRTPSLVSTSRPEIRCGFQSSLPR